MDSRVSSTFPPSFSVSTRTEPTLLPSVTVLDATAGCQVCIPPKSLTFAHTASGLALMVTVSVTFCRVGPWASASAGASSSAANIAMRFMFRLPPRWVGKKSGCADELAETAAVAAGIHGGEHAPACGIQHQQVVVH